MANDNPYLMVHPVTGPDLMPQGVNFNDTFHQKLAQAQQQFLIKGSQRGPGTYTATDTGAKALAIRHFEDATRTMQKIAAYRRAKAMI